MATNTSDALGTQRQFTPRPIDTYIKRLTGIENPREVMYEQDNRGEQLAKALSTLGDALYAEDIEQEKRQKLVADSLAPIWYSNAEFTKEERKRLTSAQLVALSSPEYGLQDNPFAIAVIDRLKGEERANDLCADFQELMKNSEHPKTLGEQLELYEAFRRENFDKDKEYITNSVAFQDGWNIQTLQNAMKVATQWRDREEARLENERFTGTMNAVHEMLSPKTFKGEELESKIKSVVSRVVNTFTADDTKNRGLITEVASTVIQYQGLDGLLSMFGHELPNGKTVGDMLDKRVLISQALDRDIKYSSAKAQELAEKMNSCTSKEELNELGDSYEDTDHLMYQQLYPQALTNIERAKREREKAAAKALLKTQQGGSAYHTLSQVFNMVADGVDRLANGNPLPRTKSEWEAYADNGNVQALGVSYAMKLYTEALVEGGKGQATDRMIRWVQNPYLGDIFKREMSENWQRMKLNASNGGDVDRFAKMKAFDTLSEGAVQLILGDSEYTEFKSACLLSDVFNDDAKALTSIAQYDKNKRLDESFSRTVDSRMNSVAPFPNAELASGDSVRFDSLPMDMQTQVRAIAKYMVAEDIEPRLAIQKAITSISKNAIRVNNSVLTMDKLGCNAELNGLDNGQRTQILTDIFKAYANQSNLTYEYCNFNVRGNNLIISDNTASWELPIPLDKLNNDVRYLVEEQARQAQEQALKYAENRRKELTQERQQQEQSNANGNLWAGFGGVNDY